VMGRDCSAEVLLCQGARRPCSDGACSTWPLSWGAEPKRKGEGGLEPKTPRHEGSLISSTTLMKALDV
jgi:hypothetical protein